MRVVVMNLQSSITIFLTFYFEGLSGVGEREKTSPQLFHLD
jgi:hypothetical protein